MREDALHAIRLLGLVGLIAVLVAACGGGADGGDEGSGEGSSGDDSGGSDSNDGGASGGPVDGFVTVDGETYEFSFDSPGRCGQEGQQGQVVSQGYTTDGTNRQVLFSYGTAAQTDSGDDILQIIIYDESNQQVWYSAVGWGASADVGSLDSLNVSGDSVSVSGELQKVADQSLADFTAEATCNQ